MKFTIHSSTIGINKPTCKLRIGSLSEFKRHPEKVFSTPMLLLHSKGGSVPHLTREVLKMTTDISAEILQVPLANSAQCHSALKLLKDGISHFNGLPECLSYCTVQDPAQETKSGYNEKTCTTIWTHTGRKQLTSQKFMDMIESFNPDMYHHLCDGDTNPNSTKKRALKSVDVSTNMFSECLERHNNSEILKDSVLLAVLEGGYDLEARQTSAQLFGKHHQVQGFVIDGLHNNGPSVENLSFKTIQPVIQETLKYLPEDKIRIAHGGWRPDVVLELVNAGVDVFDSSLVYLATERGAALTFSYKAEDTKELQEQVQDRKNGCDDDSIKDTSDELCLETNPENEITKNTRNYEINLFDKKYFEDLTPISSECKCLTCTKHTRSYIHHLLNSKELVASVLLMIHNLHHYQNFFKAIRENGKNGLLLTIDPPIPR